MPFPPATNNCNASNHVEKKAYLRVRGIPANALTNTVMVLKLEFDALPE